MEISYANQKKLPDIRTSYWDSSGIYICKSAVNDLRYGNYICKSEGILPDIRTSYWNSSGVYICKSVVYDLRHENYICKSEGIYLVHSLSLVFSRDGVGPKELSEPDRWKLLPAVDSSGVYIWLKTWTILYVNQNKIYLHYHSSEYY